MFSGRTCKPSCHRVHHTNKKKKKKKALEKHAFFLADRLQSCTAALFTFALQVGDVWGLAVLNSFAVLQVGASNELPESEELDALYDRFLIRRQVSPVSNAGLSDMLQAAAENNLAVSLSPKPLHLVDALSSAQSDRCFEVYYKKDVLTNNKYKKVLQSSKPLKIGLYCRFRAYRQKVHRGLTIFLINDMRLTQFWPASHVKGCCCETHSNECFSRVIEPGPCSTLCLSMTDSASF